MAGEINLYDSDGVKQRKIAVDDTTKRVEIRDASGNDIMDIEAHASRHQAGGDDEINLNAMKAEGDPAYIRLVDTGSGGAERRIVSDGGHAKVYDDTGAEVMDIEAHASRHAYGGDDAIADNALRFSQIDKVFGSEQTVSVDAGATATISKGIYYVRCGANTKVEYSPDGGTTWVELIAAGGVGLVISDGSNVRLNNGGTAAEDSYLLPIL